MHTSWRHRQGWNWSFPAQNSHMCMFSESRITLLSVDRTERDCGWTAWKLGDLRTIRILSIGHVCRRIFFIISYISQIIHFVPFLVTSTNFHGCVFQLILRFAKINMCAGWWVYTYNTNIFHELKKVKSRRIWEIKIVLFYVIQEGQLALLTDPDHGVMRICYVQVWDNFLTIY